MKSILIPIFLLIISGVLYGQADSYHPMPASGAIWREYFGGYQVNCTDYQIYISGDTVISGNSYQKLQQFGVVYFADPLGNCLSYFNGTYSYYMGAYRNDSANRKVYFVPEGHASEELLYDFNLKLNDKLPETYLYPYPSGFDTSFVSGIDSVLVGTEFHKRYVISTSYFNDYVILIEGIGSSFGLLSGLFPPFEFGSNLLCMKQDGVTVFPDSSYECMLVTGTKDFVQTRERISIVPNPVTHQRATVLLPHEFSDCTLELYDIAGKEVARMENIRQGALFTSETLSNGIYIYKIFIGGQVVSTGKLVIATD
jgi:hypothetical protein